MRTIKFRAWVTTENCFIQHKEVIERAHLQFGDNLGGHEDIVEQFTGLHDIDNMDLYEGDVIQLEDVICPITWDDGGFQMITSENQGKSALVQDRVKRFKCIGNIHENPNLLRP